MLKVVMYMESGMQTPTDIIIVLDVTFCVT